MRVRQPIMSYLILTQKTPTPRLGGAETAKLYLTKFVAVVFEMKVYN